MDPDRTAQLARTVVMLFSTGNIEALRNLWHPEISVASWDGTIARGIGEVDQVMRRLEEARIEMEPESMQVSGDDALVRGLMVLGLEQRRVAATWLWTFRDGLLWRSNTFLAPAEASDRSSEH